MKKLLVLAVVALAVLVEILAPPFVERRLEDEIHERTHDVVRVRADVDSFPLVTRALVTGNVQRLGVELLEVAGREIPFTVVRYDLDGISIDRSALLGGDLRVDAIDRGVISAELTSEGLSDLFGTPVEITAERIEAAARAAEVVLEVSGFAPRNLRVPTDLLPCEPDAAVVDGRIVISCTIHEVPPILLR